jgi:predicted NBD/HSP70 family sugar kinase
MTQSAVLSAPEPSIEKRPAEEVATMYRTLEKEERDMAEGVERAMRATGYGVLRAIRISVNPQAVVLGGRVTSYYLKQLAQAAATAVSGARAVHNELDVVPPSRLSTNGGF